jgi:hypothetical protein
MHAWLCLRKMMPTATTDRILTALLSKNHRLRHSCERRSIRFRRTHGTRCRPASLRSRMRDTRITLVSTRMILFGSGVEVDVTWDTHIQLVHSDDHEATLKVGEACNRTGTAGQAAFRIRNSEGKYRWFLSCLEPHRASMGRCCTGSG